MAQASGGTNLPVLQELWTAWCSLDPCRAVAEVAAAAADSLGRDAADEPTWYALLRAREILGQAGPMGAGAWRWPSLLQAVEEAARRFSGSPRLATIRARLDRGVPAARAAWAVNPAYAPAQVALGRALLCEHRYAEARALLEDVREPERVQGAGAALARARVETGDPARALMAAARETNAPGMGGVEPSIHDAALARELEEIRETARLALGAVGTPMLAAARRRLAG